MFVREFGKGTTETAGCQLTRGAGPGEEQRGQAQQRLLREPRRHQCQEGGLWTKHAMALKELVENTGQAVKDVEEAGRMEIAHATAPEAGAFFENAILSSKFVDFTLAD